MKAAAINKQNMMILLDSIAIGKTNPRKRFDEDAINELAQSVSQKGVIQPILIRPAGDGYELVCGERRYRASLIAGLKEIPAYIRELTDDEALELQITENLQRKDVHPMEEAFAIKQLLEKHSVNEVAAKLGKKDYYIKQRVKLNDLTDQAQKIFYRGALGVADALKLCMFPAEVQNDILKSEDGSREIRLDNWTLNRVSGRLDIAPFNIEDTTLDEKAGACTTCPFNTAFASLFPDSATSPSCKNITCFTKKCDVNFEREIAKAFDDPTICIISNDYHVEKKVTDRVEKAGHVVINRYGYSEIKEDAECKPNWEEFKVEYEDDYDSEKELKSAFDREVTAFEERVAQAAQKIASGKYKRAFLVDGSRRGTYTYIELSKVANSQKKSKAIIESGNAAVSDIDAEIARIKDREKRAKELDGEKVHKRIIDKMQELKVLKDVPTEFTATDRVLMRFLLQEYIGYNIKDTVKKAIGLTGSYDLGKDLVRNFEKLESLTDPEVAFLVRIIAYEKYKSFFPTNHGGYMLRQLAELFPSVTIAEFEAEQATKAEKRQKNVDKRIKELQEQKKELLAANKKPAAKKAPKKTKA